MYEVEIDIGDYAPYRQSVGGVVFVVSSEEVTSEEVSIYLGILMYFHFHFESIQLLFYLLCKHGR